MFSILYAKHRGFRCLKRSPNTRRLAGRSPMVQHQPLRPRTCQTRMRLLSATPIALALQENKGRGQPAHGWEPWWKVNPSSRWLRHLGVSRNLGTLSGMVSRGKAKGNHPPEEVALRNTHLVFNHVFLLFSFKQKEGGKRWNKSGPAQTSAAIRSRPPRSEREPIWI